jgi:undecaprenyl diphosphate synthase|tara:strand:- start:3137 stop:3874 length:738 start_codon:yes stop_codon:yes gene_type:complete
MSLLEIDREKMPKHIAVIMDGNGRWAKKRGMRREFGHRAGRKAVKKIVESCAELKIKNLTLYAFSTENWNRPKLEIDFLMQLLFLSLKDELKNLNKNNIKFETIGNLNRLPKKIGNYLEKVKEETKENSALTLTLALSYGSRNELVEVVKEISTKVKNNIISAKKIDETVINDHLYTRHLPDVDLLIRTSGEKRISNFLLWQIAYSELYFTKKMWPDFRKKDLYKAIVSYQNRERRFGKTSEQVK